MTFTTFVFIMYLVSTFCVTFKYHKVNRILNGVKVAILLPIAGVLICVYFAALLGTVGVYKPALTKFCNRLEVILNKIEGKIKNED